MIAGIYARKSYGLLVIVAFALAGCRYYYTKPSAGYTDFRADHAACVKAVGVSSGDGTLAYVAANAYRGCMQMRGWIREERTEPGYGWYRGIEEDGVVSLSAPPPPPPAADAVSAAMREHCRQLHLIRSDWRYYLHDYQRCLAR